jgi:2-C-methyl-D-erythritol 4-phosphate cytidylyltransferase
MKKFAIIVAGGAGLRMGTSVPKQFLPLYGRPVLWYTLQPFLSAYDDLEIVVVLPADGFEIGRSVADMTMSPERITLVEGGLTRYHSVQNGCRSIAAKPGSEEAVVFVHDGVRCLLTSSLIHRCYEQTLRLGSAIPVVDCRDSVRMVSGGGSVAIDRRDVKLVQTPQTFLSQALLPAYESEYRDSFTDEAAVIEAAGLDVHLIEGELNNFKLTMPEDLQVAEYLLRSREAAR